jgi:VRR-NUC domain
VQVAYSQREVAAITEIGTIEVLRSQREQWKSGHLAAEWARKFPELFDEQDVGLVETQGHFGAHHVEWLAAILLYHTTGYLSLVSKYEFANHRRKQEIVKKVLPADVLTILRDRTEHGRAQGPDLLVYAQDFSDWFFCEVKGPGDRLRLEQKRKFEALAAVSGKPVRLLRFRWVPDARAAQPGVNLASGVGEE